MIRKFPCDYHKLLNKSPYFISGLIIIVAVLLSWLLLPEFIGEDWLLSFKPAIKELISGRNPYEIERFLIAPWGLLFLFPFGYLPDSLAMAILRILGLAIYAYVAIRLGASKLGIVTILLSPQILHNTINGNIDWLCFLGFTFPTQIGIFFITLKPQIGLALGIYWLYEAIKQKRFLRTFTPFIIISVLSLLIFGFWPANYLHVRSEITASAWPISLPFGIVLLYVALKRNQVRIAQAISPLFSPHVMFHSWATMLYALAPNTTELIIAVLSSWLLVGIRAVGY